MTNTECFTDLTTNEPSLWKMDFSADLFGSGVVAIARNTILGGDSWFSVVGNYTISLAGGDVPKGMLIAMVTIARHSEGAGSAFGPVLDAIGSVQMEVFGKGDMVHTEGEPSSFEAVGIIQEIPGVDFSIPPMDITFTQIA